ncbi:hypothetical protein [Nitrospira sp. Nam74]
MSAPSDGSDEHNERPPAGFGLAVNSYLNHYVNVADAKAAGIITGNFALIGFLIAQWPQALIPLAFHWMAFGMAVFSGITRLARSVS